MNTRKLTGMALLTAIVVAGSYLPPILVAGAKPAPFQHAVNVLAAALFGPGPAVLIAFAAAVLRNLLGTGTPLAFPGGMIGALMAGYAYRLFKSDFAAGVGEVFGTGVLGALAAFPLARFVLGRNVLAYTFILPFTFSSVTGAAIGLVLLRAAAVASIRKRNEA